MERSDYAAQHQALVELAVAEDRIYTDHGLTGTTRARPGLDQALDAVREGDTLVVPILDRLARSVPDARAIADLLRERGVKLALGRALYDPGDPMGKMFFNILATFAEFEADLIRMRTRDGMAIAHAKGKLHGKQPKVSDDSSGNSAACMPPASIPSAISPNSSLSQDQPSIAHSTGALPLSVRFCPLPESTRFCQGIRPPARWLQYALLPGSQSRSPALPLDGRAAQQRALLRVAVDAHVPPGVITGCGKVGQHGDRQASGARVVEMLLT